MWRILLQIGVCVLLIGFSELGFAAEPLAYDQPKISAAAMYQKWASVQSSDIVAHAKKAAAAVLQNREKAFAQFSDPYNQTWWPNPPFFSPVFVIRCDEMRVLTHIYPSFLAQYGKHDAMIHFKDLKGKHSFFDLCTEVLKHPNQPQWSQQYHFWPGASEPVWMHLLAYPVKGTPYAIQAYYVTPNLDFSAPN